MIVQAYSLPKKNIFNYRSSDWGDSIISAVNRMLECGLKYGVTIKEVSIMDKKISNYAEIRRTNSKTLKIVLRFLDEQFKDLEFNYEIPWLIDNHFYIGGNKKVGVYQLFDKPLIYRNNIIKIRTNIMSFTLTKVKIDKKNKYVYQIGIFGKTIPFCKLILAYKGKEEALKYFEISDLEKIKKKHNDNYNILIKDFINLLSDSTEKKEDVILESYFKRKSNSVIVDNISLITDIDVFSKSFMKTDNIVDEFITAIKSGPFDDCDYSNKRIRFAEQIIYSYLCKDFYNMFNSLRKSKKDNFSINSKVLLSSANVSPIVQFDFSINPLSELALLSRLSLTGPGGFDKQNVPSHLRDIHPTIFGRICPADTADREGCGTTQYLVPTLDLKDRGIFGKASKDCINSIAISHSPFMEHNDPTRLQMASSQMRHAIMLEKFDIPMIQSGVEGMYTEQTSFLNIAKMDGEVIYINDDILVIRYIDNSCDAFDIGYKKLFLSVADFCYNKYKVGDKFKKNDIIVESNYLENGRLTIGKNLLTAVMIWYGYNYEDGIVISDKLVKEDKLTSVHYLNLIFEISKNKVLLNLQDDSLGFKPLPEIGDILTKGQIYAKKKTIYDSRNSSNDAIFDSESELTVSENCVVVNSEIFANDWCKIFPQYDDYIKSLIDQQKQKKQKLVDILSKYLTKSELDAFLLEYEISRSDKDVKNYRVKGDMVDGIRIELTAIYKRPIQIGDKVGNRHGNKGIISAIVEEKKMPTLPDGRRAEIIINPLGILSRMNVGQLYELHLSMIIYDLKKEVQKKIKEKKSKNEIFKYVTDFIKIIDKTKNQNYSKQFKSKISKMDLINFSELMDNFYIIQPPFESIDIVELDKAMIYTNTKYEYECYEPISGHNTHNLISFGYMYFIKLNHLARDKSSVRSIGPYTGKTCQPLAGKSKKGGQRLGEMEVWALAAHGATENLDEMLTTKSDSVKKRNKYISKMIQNEDSLVDEWDDEVSQGVRLLQGHLKTIGLGYEVNEKKEEEEEEVKSEKIESFNSQSEFHLKKELLKQKFQS